MQGSALDRACGQALDDVLLQQYVDHQHRDHDDHHRRCHQAVVHAGLGADLIEQQGDGALLGEAQEEVLGEQVVVAPQEGEDGHRGKGGLGGGDDDVEIDLEDVAAVHIGALLQLDGHRLDKAHQHDGRKAEVARDLRQDDGQQAQPAVARAGDAPRDLHAEHRDDSGEHREHHARHDEAVQEIPAPETVAHQAISRQARQNDHHHRDRDGDEQAVEVGVLEVEAVHRLAVVVQREAVVRSGDGEGVLADQALFAEGIQDDPHERIDRGQRPQAQHQIGDDLRRLDLAERSFQRSIHKNSLP